ncbi:3-hydroxybutyryl-CoA dehydrogenase [Paenibacillus cymbidii]|uniref:3-hydroxybutyryl-CoA dehydrogenase n=1 Tax=Paenibacillus cymbidii TaxID=1639034 RepID=UPI0010818B11|nr:3-hydroxybutyryl-CoA dehydrogenase [Paenibacillus cymbidii]
MERNRLFVVGAGRMGSGIAQTAAASGLLVTLYDWREEEARRGLARIRRSLDREAEQGGITEADAAAIMGRLSAAGDLRAAANADLVIEAVTEELEAKTALFRELDTLCPEETLFATNTSSLSITRIAAATKRPSRVMGMHFMNPVPVMRLVELIRGLATSDDTFAAIRALALQMGKTPVEVRDTPGFVVNRLLLPMINEAVFLLQEGAAAPAAIDRAATLGLSHPMGPLALADMIGLDTCLAIMDVLHADFGDSKYRPCPLLRCYVDAGWLGKKSGRGFYEYPG